MNRRTGLGRGLAALIPPSEEEADGPAAPHGGGDHGHDQSGGRRPPGDGGDPDARAPSDHEEPSGPAPTEAGSRPTIAPGTAELLELSVEAIAANPRQPREVFDPGELEGLAVSLADVGVLQPLVVRPDSEGGYELIAGERRLRAAQLAGLTHVPAVVRHTDDAGLLKEALVENIHRVQLNPLEEAAAYQQLLEEFGVTQEELASRLGRSRSAIANTIRLLRLPPAVQRRIAAGVLSAGHARALLALDDADAQQRLAERIVAEGLSVRDVEELVRLRLSNASPDDARTGPASRRRAMDVPGLVELQQDLSDALETRVKISMGARKGRIAVEFTSVDDLERIVGVIAAGLGESDGAGTEALGGPLDGEDAERS